MTTNFTWPVQAKLAGAVKFAVLTAQFGDGYKQTAADGINNQSQSWSVVIRGPAAQVTPARDFLNARAGYQSFFWTPPLGAQGYYECTTWASATGNSPQLLNRYSNHDHRRHSRP
jgi:phage-related protein